jgi:ABC-type uncharacterized transport system auxiliary subunit
MTHFFRPLPGLWIALLLFLLMSACTTVRQPRLKIEHYTLEYAPPGPRSKRPPLPVILKIERFSVAPSYNARQMVYRDRSFKRELDPYHQWRAHPGDLVSDHLARDMRHSGLFKAAVQEGSALTATHIIEGSLDEFFEWNDEAGRRSVLSVTATLITAKEVDISKRVLFQKTFRALEPMREKTPRGLAEAMSEAMSRVSGEIIKTVYQHLSLAHGP